MTGRSKDRPELAATAIPLEAKLPGTAEPWRRGADPQAVRAARLFGGARARTARRLVSRVGREPLLRRALAGTQRLQDLLTHLYVLVPVLDDEKHYWVGDDEVEKLLRRGGDWLPAHPEREAIAYGGI